MSHYNNISKEGAITKNNSNEIGSFEKSVMSNSRQSIQKHLTHLKIQQNQLNYALFLSLDHFKLEQHTQQCILLLLRHKANPNCDFNKQTPLTVACRKGQQLLVKLLLQYGAKADLCNKYGQHPLSIVLKDKRQNYDVAQVLINSMASVNIEVGGVYPIISAVHRQFFKIFQMLIEKGSAIIFESQNILHIIAKKQFRRLDKKKKFIKQLSGRIFLMQEDSYHKLPTDYQQNQQMKHFIMQNFKPKIIKQESYKQDSNSKINKQKQQKQNKLKDTEVKQTKKKVNINKDLDVSFSEVDEQEYQQQKADLLQDSQKLQKVIEIPQQQQKIQNKVQKIGLQNQSKNINTSSSKKLINIVTYKDADTNTINKQKSVQKIDQDTVNQKLKQQQLQKLKKKQKPTNQIKTTDSKKKLNGNQIIKSIKKKQKINQQIIPKTLLKRKNSSIEQQNIKIDKNKAITVKKINGNNKKQNIENLQKIQKQKLQQQNNQIKKNQSQIINQQFEIADNEKTEKQSQTDSQEGYQGLMANLNQQIYDLVNKISLKNQQKIGTIQQILKFLQKILRQQLQKQKQNLRLELYVYGSQATGLAIQHSDIDILVFSDLDTFSLMKMLQLRNTLNIQAIQQCKFLTSATVPVIKLIMGQRFQYMHIDITFQNKNHMGLKCCDMIKSFMQVEPLLRPLVLVLKMLIEVYDISDPYKGGLSSYAITLMVIALLQFTQAQKKKPQYVGQLLLNFFYFYGEQIDYVSQAIIIHDIGLFGSQPLYCIYRLPYMTDLNPKLIIYDPLNPVNNVGRTTYRISALKKIFSVWYLRLKLDPQCRLKDIMDGSFIEVVEDFQ